MENLGVSRRWEEPEKKEKREKEVSSIDGCFEQKYLLSPKTNYIFVMKG
jgi:hypothetical protein